VMRIHARHLASEVKVEKHEGQPLRYKGVLFRFGEISHNRTMVRPGARVRVAGDAILVDHEYPDIDSYKPYGRILAFYRKDDALLIDFELTAPEANQLVENGKHNFLSVSWFSDGYEVKEDPQRGTYIEFYDIVIYEVSLVSDPAFNTCIATSEDGLACLSSSVAHVKSDECQCRRKSVSLSDMTYKHQEITREEFEALKEEVKQLRDAIAVLAAEVKALKEVIAKPPEEVVVELEQAKKKLEQLELVFGNQANEFGNVLQIVSRLIDVTDRTHKNLQNLLEK
jgi:FtsZ-binding cell division protein ZapB